MSNLKQSDYKDILKFYKIDSSQLDKAAIKAKAENLIATKLCRCIKNIQFSTLGKAPASKGEGKGSKGPAPASKGKGSKGEGRAISICINSVVQKKNLKTFRFTCKKGAKLLGQKNNTRRKLLIVKKV
jgi:hypothetical protein